MLTYILIFLLKIVENTFSTLRVIVVSNGKKKLGAILNGVIALLWIFAISITIINIDKDILKVFFFVIGSICGSYLGSLLEEKIALGNCVLVCKVKQIYEAEIKEILKNYQITTIVEKDINYSILLIFIKRKEIYKINSIIKKIDKSSIIISEKAKTLI